MGTTPAYTQVRDLQIADGVFFSDQDVTDRNRVAVIGPTVLQDLFADPTSNASATPDRRSARRSASTANIFTVDRRHGRKRRQRFQQPGRHDLCAAHAAQHYLLGQHAHI